MANGAPLERLELSLSAPEADALSTELQGRTKKFYHTRPACSICGQRGREAAKNFDPSANLGNRPALCAGCCALLCRHDGRALRAFNSAALKEFFERCLLARYILVQYLLKFTAVINKQQLVASKRVLQTSMKNPVHE